MTETTDDRRGRREYFVTFGSQYTPRNQRHPNYDKAHADGWVVVHADDYEQARAEVVRRLGVRWSMLYGDDGFSPEYFPLGELDRWDARQPIRPAGEYPCWELRDLYDRVRSTVTNPGLPDSSCYADEHHRAHDEHLHFERGVLLTCLGYVRPGVDTISANWRRA